VLLLDDGGYKANRSLFEFFNIFGEQKVDVLRVNIEDEDLLRERFKENYNLINKSGDPLKVIVEEVKKYDFIIMGDLKYAVMLEKITGKLGIKLLEAIKKPIFIG
ncbi:MAG: GntR family transcriptional regulator, partial [Leptotrichiaceae bacterium]